MNPNGSAESRIDVLNLVKRAVEKLDEDLKGRVIEHASMTEDEEKALIADHFLFRGKDKMQAASGYHEHWPHGRGWSGGQQRHERRERQRGCGGSHRRDRPGLRSVRHRRVAFRHRHLQPFDS
jgi:hypothetical protein